MKRVFCLLPCLLLLGAVGCNSGQKRTYDVTLKNNSVDPVTIWLTKNGPPWEEGWKSPEDLAIESPHVDERIAGVVVPPGKTASVNNRTGLFAPHVDAILRVYHGQKMFNELLAIDRDSPNRTDVLLYPGKNDLEVHDENGLVKVARVQP